MNYWMITVQLDMSGWRSLNEEDGHLEEKKNTGTRTHKYVHIHSKK